MTPSYSLDANDARSTPAIQLRDFTTLHGPNGELVSVPRYMVPLVELQMAGMRQTGEMPLEQVKNGVSVHLTID
jgi:hypothetical protein